MPVDEGTWLQARDCGGVESEGLKEHTEKVIFSVLAKTLDRMAPNVQAADNRAQYCLH